MKLVTTNIENNELVAHTRASGPDIVNTDTTYDKIAPFSISLRDPISNLINGYVTLWRSIDQDGDGEGVFGQRFDLTGVRVGGEFRVNDTTIGNQGGINGVGLDDGGFVVTWHSDEQDGDNYGAYAARYDANGNKVPGFEEVQVNKTTAGLQAVQGVVQNFDGSLQFVYRSAAGAPTGDPIGDGVLTRRFDLSGNALTDEVLVNQRTNGDQRPVDIVSLQDGSSYVFFGSELSPGQWGYVGRYLSSAGVPLGSPAGDEFAVTSSTAGNAASIRAIVLSNETIALAYRVMTSEGLDVFVRLFDPSGAPIGAEFRVSGPSANDQFLSGFIALDGGGFALSYYSLHRSSIDADIYVEVFENDGSAIGSPVLVNSEGLGFQAWGTLASLRDGNFVVTTANRGPAPQTISQTIFQRPDATPTITGTAGNDVLIGGSGDDLLEGGSGSDVYVFAPGFGNDVIDDPDAITISGRSSIIRFEGTIGPDDLRFVRPTDTADLVIEVGSSDSITVRDFFSTSASAGANLQRIQQIEFENDPPLSMTGGLNLEGTAGDDIVRGSGSHDRIDAGPGNDVLQGDDGNDVLIGGSGDDLLEGGSGSDVYVFAPGFGNDVIDDPDAITISGRSSIIRFEGTIGPDDLRFVRPTDTADLVIEVGSSDSITVRDFFSTSASAGANLQRIQQIEFENDPPLSMTGGLNLEGTAGDDIVRGSGSHDRIDAGPGNDVLQGDDGNDVLIGGSGDDLLEGGSGSDVYVFAPGFGNDVIDDPDAITISGRSSIIRFEGTIGPDDLRFVRPTDTADLVIEVGSSDSITVRDFFSTSASAGANLQRIQQIEFENDPPLSMTGGLNLEGTAGDDIVRGSGSHDRIDAGPGNDVLQGDDGNDVLIGGSGDDLLEGGSGSDVYVFAPGFGNDVIDDPDAITISGRSSIIRFEGTIGPDDLRFVRPTDTADLVIEVGSSDSITVRDFFSTSASAGANLQRIQQIEFENDPPLSMTGGLNLEGTAGDDIVRGSGSHDRIDAGPGNDVLQGDDGNDVLIGGSGDDLLEGGSGSDVYVFAPGFGNDVIDDPDAITISGRSSIIRFEGTIGPDDLRFVRPTDTADLVIEVGSSDSITVRDFFSTSASAGANLQRIQQIEFENDPPLSMTGGLNLEGTAGDDTYELASNTSRVLDVLANDSGGAGGELEVSDFAQPSHGTVTQNPDGTLTYTPNAAYVGNDSFTYRASDGVNPPVEATVSILVLSDGVNSAPRADDDRYRVDEDTQLTVASANGILSNDFDAEGGLTISLLRGVQNGNLSLNPDGSFSYTPDADFDGQDSFIYAVSDDGGLRDTATVRISVSPVNDAPVARDDTLSTFENRVVSGNVISVPEDTNPSTEPLSDTDVDLGDSLNVTKVNGSDLTGSPILLTSGALLSMNADGTFSYNPNGAFNLSAGATTIDSFTYTIEDEGGLSDQASVSVTIRADEDAPNLIALPQNFSGGETDTQAQISYRVENQGNVAATGPWVDRIYLSLDQTLDENDELLREVSYTGNLEAGSFYERTVTVLKTPEIAGDYFVLVDVDARDAVLESDENNIGVSADTGVLSAAFSSTLEVSTITATVGSSVTLSGTAGEDGAFEFVLVEVVNEDGDIQTANVLTDADGDWTINLPIAVASAGLLEVNARHPGNPNEDAAPEATIQVFGMGFAAAPQTVEVIYGETLKLDLAIENFGSLNLTGLTASLSNLPTGWTGDVSLADTSLDGDGTLIATLEVTLPELAGLDFRVLDIEIESTEGAVTRTQVAIDPVSSFADIVVDLDDGIEDGPDTQLEAWMLRGEQEIVSFTITNEGSTASAPLTVILPDLDWMGLVSPTVIESLAPGESTGITLSLMPDAELPLAEYSGNLIVSEAGGDVETVAFSFTAVEDDTGSLTLTMTDELYYFADGSPTVDDTRVEVKNALTGEVVFSSNDVDGTVTIDDLPEGYYNIRVNADDHDSFASTLYVNAGQDVEQEAFMSRQSVKYYWSVEEIAIEDRYEVIVEAEFETNVPEPVVVVEPRTLDLFEVDEVGESKVFEVTVVNHGFIAVEDVDLGFDDHPLYDIEVPDGVLSLLEGKSSITIPVTITKTATLEEYTEGYYDSRGIDPDDDGEPGFYDGADGSISSSPDAAPFIAEAATFSSPIALFSAGAAEPEETGGLDPADFPVTPGSIPCQTGGGVSYKYECGPHTNFKWVAIEIINPEGDCPPGGPGVGGGAGGGFGGGGGGGGFGGGGGGFDGGGGGFGGFGTATEGGAPTSISSTPPTSPPVETCEPSDDPCISLDLVDFRQLAADIGKALRDAGLEFFKFGRLFKAGQEVFNEISKAAGFLDSAVEKAQGGDAAGAFADYLDAGSSVKSGLKAAIKGVKDFFNKVSSAAEAAAELLKGLAKAAAGVLADVKEECGTVELRLYCELMVLADNTANSIKEGLGILDDKLNNGIDRSFDAFCFVFDNAGSVIRDLLPENRLEGLTDQTQTDGGDSLVSLDGSPEVQSEDRKIFISNKQSESIAINQQPTNETIVQELVNVQNAFAQLRQDIGEDTADKIDQENEELGQVEADVSQLEPTVIRQLEDHQEDIDGGVCASVRIQISQDAIMTRQAFEATLEVVNEVDQPIVNLFLEIIIYDQDGNLVEENAFGIDDPILSGLTGVDGTGVIEAGATGSAVFTVIPSRLAAADEATTYFVSGNFGYTQDGEQITIPLSREEISVRPQAELELDYFLQRDVLGDDPFTDDFDQTTTDDIEESVPATLAVMVSNVGGGDATNLRIISAQPEIIENEKGLLVDFEIIGSTVNGQPAQPTLEADFGTVAAGDREVATWLLESTLQGKFVDYDVAFQHLNDLGIPELSLITEARIHELIQTVDADGDTLPDFLVNDSGDALGIPDRIYTSTGDILEVGLGLATASATTPVDGGSVEVSAQVGDGWTYFSLLEPSNAALEIVEITRDIDGDGDQDVLDSDNWWVTDRTFPAEGRPTYENVLHILDDGASGTTTYTVVYGAATVSNTAPVAANDSASTDAGAAVEIAVLANDSDADLGTLAVKNVTQAANGMVTYSAGGSVLAAPLSGFVGALVYTPYAGFIGTDTFTYTVTDNQGATSSATVSVTVEAVGVTVEGTDAADTLSGTETDDILDGLDGNDRLLGLGGDDTLVGGLGDDTLNGGAGNDDIDGGDGGDSVYAGEGDDDVVGGAGNDLLEGQTGDDTIDGDEGNDVLRGGAGLDSMDGGDGNDILRGGDGEDTLAGGAGNDTLDGNLGNDTIDGGIGDDILIGASGADVLNGGAGNDRLRGGGGDDILRGGNGDDLLFGASNEDVLYGGAGNDLLEGNTQADELYGGEGNDILRGGDGYDYLNGGDGDDVLGGGRGNDRLIGLAGNDTLFGGDGNDNVFAGEGNDDVEGGAGNDLLEGQAGDDAIDGGEGDDILRGGAGVDELNGGDGDDILRGGDGDDTLTGGAGNDTLDGNLGNDTIDGGIGDDILIGAAGADLLNGGEGQDRLRGGGGDDILDGGDGDDLLFGAANEDILYGGAGNDLLEGNTQADELYGGEGNDILRGGDGFDYLEGGDGDDVLAGGNGNDILIGGLGRDTLRGNANSDVFVFLTASDTAFGSADLVDGFDGAGEAGGDLLDFSAIDADASLSGDQAFTFLGELSTNDGLAAGAGSIWVENRGDQTVVFGITDNDSTIDFSVKINDGADSAYIYIADDFVL